MRIGHIAIWVKDIEAMKDFYCRYFNAVAGKKYINAKKKFESYFLSFDDGGRLELVSMTTIPATKTDEYKQFTGLAHFALCTGDEKKVNELTKQLVLDGFELIDGPRWTGDGYYESVILDPEKNRIEITT